MKKYEVTWIDETPRGIKTQTKILTQEQCYRMFGKEEFNEILEGYDPSIVAVEI